MRAVILAGGTGSRLRPFTFTIPKPLVPIGEMPIIEILIRQLAGQGFDRITISVGHLASLIRAVCGDGSHWGVEVDYVEEEQPLGTAGGLSLIKDLGGAPVLVINGDTLTDLDFAAAVRKHSPEAGITICTNRREVAIDFGVLQVADDGLLLGYREKPTLEYLVSMGVYVVSDWVIEEYIPEGERLDMPDLIRGLIENGHPVRTHDADAYWLDLGRIDDLEQGDSVFRSERARFLPD
ncbi:MAG: sugar phosphate nucleotidyltransferase [Acidimicrobiia bacterium]